MSIAEGSVNNVLGELVWNMSPSPRGRWGGLSVDLSDQPGGFYFLKVKTEEGVGVMKIVIQK